MLAADDRGWATCNNGGRGQKKRRGQLYGGGYYCSERDLKMVLSSFACSLCAFRIIFGSQQRRVDEINSMASNKSSAGLWKDDDDEVREEHKRGTTKEEREGEFVAPPIVAARCSSIFHFVLWRVQEG